MLKKCSMSVLFVLFLLFMTIPLFAQNNPFQIALVTPVQLVPEDDSVSGIRLNLIYGRNTTITGLDLGLINHDNLWCFRRSPVWICWTCGF